MAEMLDLLLLACQILTAQDAVGIVRTSEDLLKGLSSTGWVINGSD
jgi:hypothetical protein